MRGQVIGSLAVLLLGACRLFGPAWPDGYRMAICAATDHLGAVHGQLASVLAAVQSQDVDQVAIGAAGMEREAGVALAAVEAAPAWHPGAALTSNLGLAAVGFMRAADQFRIGARQGSGPAFDTAVAAAQDAEAALARAELDVERLGSTNGWQPC